MQQLVPIANISLRVYFVYYCYYFSVVRSVRRRRIIRYFSIFRYCLLLPCAFVLVFSLFFFFLYFIHSNPILGARVHQFGPGHSRQTRPQDKCNPLGSLAATASGAAAAAAAAEEAARDGRGRLIGVRHRFPRTSYRTRGPDNPVNFHFSRYGRPPRDELYNMTDANTIEYMT